MIRTLGAKGNGNISGVLGVVSEAKTGCHVLVGVLEGKLVLHSKADDIIHSAHIENTHQTTNTNLRKNHYPLL